MEINGKSPLIDLSTRTNRLEVQEQQAQQAQRFQKTDPGSQVSDRDRVELSVRSREMQHIHELIRSTPDVREGLVQQVRQSLDNGTYNVKAEQVADKIIGGSFIDQGYSERLFLGVVMTDDFGRVNPVSQHLLDRGGRGERYQGRHARKHHSGRDGAEPEIELEGTEEAEVPTAGTLVDVRI